MGGIIEGFFNQLFGTTGGVKLGEVSVIGAETGTGRPVLPAVAHSLKVLLDQSNNSHTMRTCSDDYDWHEQSKGCGEDYYVRVGDVSFSFHFVKYNAHSVSVTVDRTHVMSYRSTPDKCVFDGIPGELSFANGEELPKLSDHVRSAAVTLSGRIKQKELERQMRDAQFDREREERDAATFARFT